MRFLTNAFACGLLSFATSIAAQSYPSKPITLIVPFAAGGPTDSLARILAEPLKQTLGQTILVENVTGAGGTIGLARAARAAPDGYTVILGNWTSHVGTPALFPIQQDVLKDFEPVARLPVSRLWITGKTGLPAKDAAELVAWLKNGAKATFGTRGPFAFRDARFFHAHRHEAPRGRSADQRHGPLVRGGPGKVDRVTTAALQEQHGRRTRGGGRRPRYDRTEPNAVRQRQVAVVEHGIRELLQRKHLEPRDEAFLFCAAHHVDREIVAGPVAADDRLDLHDGSHRRPVERGDNVTGLHASLGGR